MPNLKIVPKAVKAVALSAKEKLTKTQNLKSLVVLPPRTAMNTDLSAARVSTLTRIFGEFKNLPTDCDGRIGNAKIAANTETRNVGPFKVTGHRAALDDLVMIFAEVKEKDPELYELLGTAGVSCYRCVRNRPGVPSNHAAGTAIDMKIGGTLTLFGARLGPQGLVKLYAYFHKYGWFWAQGYRGRTDPMHFEMSDERLRLLHLQGKL